MRQRAFTGPETEFALGQPLIYTATVYSVDPATYTMRVRSKYRGISSHIEVPSLFSNVRDSSGAGVHLMPEVGAEVWVCETSDGAVVPLIYHSVVGETGYRGNKPLCAEGDLIMSTNDGASIRLLKGASVILESSPVCKLMLNPVSDSILSISSQYQQYSLSYKMDQICIDADRTAETIQAYFIGADDDEPTVVSKVGNYGNHVYEFSINSTNFLIKSSGEGRVAMQSDTIDIDSPRVTIGTVNPVELMKVAPFLVDLQAVLVELGKVVGVLDALLTAVPIPPTPTPNLIPITDMLASIQSGIYATNKLKSE